MAWYLWPIGGAKFSRDKKHHLRRRRRLLINDRDYVERAEIIREKGTNRSKFFRGQVDKYTWVDVGSSYLMSDVLSGLSFCATGGWPSIQEKRRIIWERYALRLSDWSSTNA